MTTPRAITGFTAGPILRGCVGIVLMLTVLAGVFPVMPVALAGTGQINRVTVLGSGTYPYPAPANLIVSQTIGGTPAVITMSFGNYYVNSVSFAGNPGTVNAVVSMDAYAADGTPTNEATVNFSVDVNSGAVTATVSGPSMSNNPLTLTVDGVATTAANGGGTVTINGNGTVDDRAINVCVTGPPRICIDVYMLSDEPPPPRRDPDQYATELREAIRRNIVRAIRLWADQLTEIMVTQVMMIGPLLDAKHQLESQQLFGELTAEAHRDYNPSEQVCAFGTLTRSMVNAEDRVRRNTTALNAIMQKRDLLSGYSASAWGPFNDMSARLVRYRDVFCDPNDNKRELGTMCTSGTSTRKNNDIDYYRTVGRRLTLNIDFTNNQLTPDEEDVLALGKNLFNHTVLTPIPERVLMPAAQFNQLQDARALTAVRSIARNSYASIVAQKTPGSGLSAQQLRAVMYNLGLEPARINEYLGVQPSYYAQMNVLSKKLFQDPQFITNLYISPANVARTGVAMQALQIMHDRQRYEASMRKEMLLSMILEMNLREEQRTVKNNIARQTR